MAFRTNRITRSVFLTVALLTSASALAATDWSAQDYDLYPGDFDGDGKTDLLYVAKDASKASGIARSDGSGPNIPFQSWPSNYLGIQWSTNAYTVTVADFNGDGRADLFLQRSVAGDHFLLLANSHGKITGISQTVPNSWLGLVWSADQHRIVSGDFTGDGRADLFLQATGASGLNALVAADANGQFTASSMQSWNDGYLGFKWSTRDAFVHAGDFNGDNRADLLIQARPKFVLIDYEIPFPVPTYPPNMNGVVLAQAGSTPFALSGVQAWSRTAFGVDWSPLASVVLVGDFNGDGRRDVVLQSRIAGRPSYLATGNASGTIFNPGTALASNVSWSADSNRLIAGNFDGTSGEGVFFQTLVPSGANTYANTVTGGTVTLTTHDATLPTGVVPATAVGRTPGSFAVSSTGAATYNIPIIVPPGVAGIQPSIAINYHAGRGSGLLGVGWGLSGFSEIERCKKTLVQDNSNNAPLLQPSDASCLDGNKLRLTGGTYGASGSTYQTEIDQFTRITAYSAGGAGPGYFIAEGKNGLTYEYGRTSSSRDDPTLPSNWLLNKVKDRVGNYMTINYFNVISGFDIRPSTITYTSNDAASLASPFQVKFVYEVRPTSDILTRNTIAGTMRETFRLKAIETWNGSSMVRDYKLSYNTSGASPRSRLSAVQECGGNGSCLSPTMISWQDGQLGMEADQVAANLGTLAGSAFPIDIDADGRADVVYPSSSTGTWWRMLASASGGYTAAADTGIAHSNNYQKAIPLDYNVDGRLDLLVPNASNQWQVLRSTGTGFTVVPTGYAATGAGNQAWVADINGDAYPDLVFVGAGNTQLLWRLNSASGFAAATPVLYTAPSGSTVSTTQTFGGSSIYQASIVGQGDFNGDGRADLLLSLTSSGIPVPKVFLSTGTTLADSGYTFSDVRSSTNVSQVLTTWRALDANADGISDLAFVDSAGVWKVLYGRPGTTLSSPTASSASYYVPIGVGSFLAADWNGDGLTDILAANNPPPAPGGSWQWMRATGDTLAAISGGQGSFTGPTNTNLVTVQQGTNAVDVNGDGLADLTYADSSGNWHYRLHKGAYPDLVAAITDGFGNTVSIAYAPLTDGTVYTKGSTSSYPSLDLQLPMYVVKRYGMSDGIGGTYNVNATYSGARLNVLGRGFEGFASTTEVDSRTGIATTTTFNQSFPLTGTVASTTARQPNGKTIEETTVHHTDLVTGATPFADRHHPFADSVTETWYEVSASLPAIDGAAVSRTTTTTVVDSYGTPTSVTETTEDLTGASPVTVRTMVTSTLPSNDTTPWCLGFMTQQTVTNTIPGEPAQMRTTQFVKDTANPQYCRPSQKIIEPTNAPLAVTTAYAYDVFGNVNSETISGTGMTTRVIQTSYGTQGVLQRSVTNGEGEVTSMTYNYSFGAPLTITDANGVLTTFTYDALGRKTGEIRADGTSTTWTLYPCGIANNHCGDSLLRYQIQQRQLDAGGGLVRLATQLYDSHSRTKYLQSQTIAGNTANVAVVYDAEGRIARQTQPYFSSAAAVFTDTSYDLVGRKLTEQQRVSDTDPTIQTTSYGYNRLSSTFTDANGRTTTKLANAFGQTVQVTDPNGGITSYQYEPFGNLRRTTGPQGDQVVDHYNIRGFKDASNDPDMGNVTYDYYPTGELKSQTNARLQTVTFTYDRAGLGDRQARQSHHRRHGPDPEPQLSVGPGRQPQAAPGSQSESDRGVLLRQSLSPRLLDVAGRRGHAERQSRPLVRRPRQYRLKTGRWFIRLHRATGRLQLLRACAATRRAQCRRRRVLLRRHRQHGEPRR